jgi:uncharacterized damage-inducible protein DinB
VTEAARLIEELQRQIDGEPWHGPSVMDVLEGVTSDQAAQRVSKSAHSIWELVLHMTGWKREVAARLKGKEAGEPAAGDWPAIGDVDEARWRAAKADLFRAQQELASAIGALPPERLHEPVKDFRDNALGTGMTAYQTISGIMQHDVYHAGQIALLKKIVSNTPRPL